MKIMVIDDEPIVTAGLHKLIPWEENGFEWAGTAENGEEALELILLEQPELIILDCKMPVMDGLALLEKINELQLPIKSIILSGYDEFMYAQKALKLGASDYLLKPPDLVKLLEVSLRIKKEKEAEALLKKQMKENHPVMIERFLQHLIDGTKKTPEDFREKAEYLQLSVNAGPFVMILLEIADTEDKMDHYSYEDRQLMYFAVLNIAEETLGAWPSKVLFQEHTEKFVIIVNVQSSEEVEQLRRDLKAVIENLRQTLRLSSTVGGSRFYTNLLSDGRKSYEEAKLALQYKYYTGLDQTIFIEDLEWEKQLDTESKRDLRFANDEELHMSLRVCNSTGLESWVQAFVQSMKEGSFTSQETKMMSLQTMITACHTLIDMHAQLQLDRLITTNNIDMIFKAQTLDQLGVYVNDFLLNLMSLTRELRKSGKNVTVEKTKQFIKSNYPLNITLDSIAAEVFLSPVYLSFLFKQVEMVTLTDYITNVRLEHAKELLQTTSLKANEIAGQVGYPDNKYFSRIFKKKVGLTPSEYRNQRGS